MHLSPFTFFEFLNAFQSCSNLESISLPGLTTIAESTFDGCSKLQEVRVPSTLERIGDMVFNNCNNLNNVYTYTVLPINIDQNTFTNFKATTLWVPFGIIFCTILHHFLLKPKLEHAVGNEDAVLFQGDQFLVDEGFLDAVDIGFAAQRIGFSYSLGGET